MPAPILSLPEPKLLDRVRWHLRVKHYSLRTERAYCDWIRRYILFHGKRHPSEMAKRKSLPSSATSRLTARSRLRLRTRL